MTPLRKTVIRWDHTWFCSKALSLRNETLRHTNEGEIRLLKMRELNPDSNVSRRHESPENVNCGAEVPISNNPIKKETCGYC